MNDHPSPRWVIEVNVGHGWEEYMAFFEEGEAIKVFKAEHGFFAGSCRLRLVRWTGEVLGEPS